MKKIHKLAGVAAAFLAVATVASIGHPPQALVELVFGLGLAVFAADPLTQAGIQTEAEQPWN